MKPTNNQIDLKRDTEIRHQVFLFSAAAQCHNFCSTLACKHFLTPFPKYSSPTLSRRSTSCNVNLNKITPILMMVTYIYLKEVEKTHTKVTEASSTFCKKPVPLKLSAALSWTKTTARFPSFTKMGQYSSLSKYSILKKEKNAVYNMPTSKWNKDISFYISWHFLN